MIVEGLAATWPRWWHGRAEWAADFVVDRAARRGSNALLASALAVARASDHLMASGSGVFQTFGPDALARIDGVGAFVGGTFENKIRNPRGEGGTIGTIGAGGAWPTYFFGIAANGTNGLSYQFLGTGVEDGLSFLDLRISGTNGGAGSSPDLIVETLTHAAAATGQTWGADCWMKLIAGMAPGACSIAIYEATAAGGPLGGTAGAAVMPTAIRQRISHKRTLPAATTAFTSSAIRFAGFTNGVARDATYRIYAPKLIGPLVPATAWLPDYPILPPVGAPADMARAADDVRAASFDWFGAAGLGTGFSFLVDLDLDHVGDGVERHVLDFSDGTDNERATLRLTAAGTLELTTARAGVTTVLATSAPALTIGSVRLAGRIVDGQSRLAVTGRAPIASAAAPIMPASLDRLRIGARWNGGGELNDVLRTLQVTRPLGDADMDAWVAA